MVTRTDGDPRLVSLLSTPVPRVSVSKTSVFRCKTSPCVPAPRPHVVTHVRVVPVDTGTFLNLHTEVFSACQAAPHTTPHTHHTTPHTPHNTTHTHTHTHTTHTTQHHNTQHHTETETERHRDRDRERQRKKTETERDRERQDEKEERMSKTREETG